METLLSLPLELQHKVLAGLDVRGQARLRQASRAYRELVDQQTPFLTDLVAWKHLCYNTSVPRYMQLAPLAPTACSAQKREALARRVYLLHQREKIDKVQESLRAAMFAPLTSLSPLGFVWLVPGLAIAGAGTEAARLAKSIGLGQRGDAQEHVRRFLEYVGVAVPGCIAAVAWSPLACVAGAALSMTLTPLFLGRAAVLYMAIQLRGPHLSCLRKPIACFRVLT